MWDKVHDPSIPPKLKCLCVVCCMLRCMSRSKALWHNGVGLDLIQDQG
jgi:hypothetical protein